MTGRNQVVSEIFQDTATLLMELRQWLNAAETADVCVAVICKTQNTASRTEHERFLIELEQMV